MIVESLVFSVVLALLVWVPYWARIYGLARALMLLALAPLFAGLLSIFVVQTLLVYLLLIATFEIAKCLKLRPRWFATCCASCIGVVFGGMMLLYLPNYVEHQRLRARYPLEDIAPRLNYEPPMSVAVAESGKLPNSDPTGNVPMVPSTWEAIDDLEAQLDVESRVFLNPHRYRHDALGALSQVHANFVLDFVRQPSFGFRRMPMKTPLRESHIQMPAVQPIPQPASPSVAPPDSADRADLKGNLAATELPVDQAAVTAHQPDPLTEFNTERIVDFARLESLGFVNPQREVRGFLAHGFRTMPGDLKRPGEEYQWKLARLELVSLLKHPSPVAYLSDRLPAMDELKTAPTRSLNDFEAAAIDRLRHGKEIVADSQHNQLRMVGAIRAARQCLECHRITRGGLLGAFTYRFCRDPLLPEVAR